MTPQVFLASGLDPSGGAGFLADAAVCRMLGTRPVGVLTGATVQDTNGVRRVESVDLELLEEQVLALLSDVEIKAAKIGMLCHPEVARSLGKGLDLTSAPVVWDPVNKPSQGPASLYSGDVKEALNLLSRHITVITPNLVELGLLAGRAVPETSAGEAAKALSERYGVSVLVTGVREGGQVLDWVCSNGVLEAIKGDWIEGGERIHGSGCALSAAVAANLAMGTTVVDSCRSAVEFIRERIPNATKPGRGAFAIV